MALLCVRDLCAGYRSGTVLNGVDLDVEEGQVVAVLGRNGVGKTTFVLTVMGMVHPTAGSVALRGVEITGWRTDEIARAGVGLVPQGRRIFAPLTVDENLRVASRRARRGHWDLRRVLDLFPRLAERRRHRGDQLSGGEQQMLAIGRVLLTNPTLLLLDEPSEGLAPAVAEQITAVIRIVRDEGLSVVLVEQDLHLAFSVASEIAVMEKGRVVHLVDTQSFRRDRGTAERLLGLR